MACLSWGFLLPRRAIHFTPLGSAIAGCALRHCTSLSLSWIAPERKSVSSTRIGRSSTGSRVAALGFRTGSAWPMVTKCADPPCSARFRYLREGRLFRLEAECDKEEYFWLCSECASKMLLKVEKGRGVVTLPLQTANLLETPSAAAAFRCSWVAEFASGWLGWGVLKLQPGKTFQLPLLPSCCTNQGWWRRGDSRD